LFSLTLLAVLSVEVLAGAVCENKIIENTTLILDGTKKEKQIASLKILDACYEVSGY